MKKILGLDLSLTSTGVSCDTCGTSVIKTKTRGMTRLDSICQAVEAHLEHTDVCIIEGYSFGSRGRAIFNIGELGGVIRLMLHKYPMDYIDVPPSLLKKFATNKGNANKDEVVAAAIRNFAFLGSNNNEADAYILNRMGHAYFNNMNVLNYQQQALDKVQWSTDDSIS